MIKMMIAVVLVFNICWLPINIFIIIGDITETIFYYEHIIYIWFLVHWLAMSHSSWNWIIYCWMNSKFRDGFKLFLSRFTCCRSVRFRSTKRSHLFRRFGLYDSFITTSSSNNSILFSQTPPTSRTVSHFSGSPTTRIARTDTLTSLKLMQSLKRCSSSRRERIFDENKLIESQIVIISEV